MVFGAVGGRIIQNGKSAPDGTKVAVRVSSGLNADEDPLLQTVYTSGGSYGAATIGGNRDNGADFWDPTTIAALGTSVLITPTGENSVQDIVAP